MTISSIPIITVSYNSVELMDELLNSLRKYYENPVYVIDGSEAGRAEEIGRTVGQFSNTYFHHFDYNIHHGPGMAWAIENLGLSGRVLFLDSDIIVLNNGFIESLNAVLQPDMYGVGYVYRMDSIGLRLKNEEAGIEYLHPACMLCNIEAMRKWPLPTMHGSPMTVPMTALHHAGMSRLVKGVDWIRQDFDKDEKTKTYLRHDWRGTVDREGSYHLDEWRKTERYNIELMQLIASLIPPNSPNVIEVGACSDYVARLYKRKNTDCLYTCVNSNLSKIPLTKGFFETMLNVDIEKLSAQDFANFQYQSCWIFDRTLEKMRDPWQVLSHIRSVIPANGAVVACIHNIQHWFIQTKLACGDFRYEESEPIQKTQLRWFTRQSIFQLFQQTGFRVVDGHPSIPDEEMVNETIKEAISSIAALAGVNPEFAVRDAMATHYLVKAVPV